LHEADQRARGVVSAADGAKMLRRDLVAAIGKSRDPATISRAELGRRLDEVRDGVPGHAAPRPGSVSTFRARLHGLFETALARGLVQTDPLSGYRNPRLSRVQRIERAERRAGRMLPMPEVAALWAACGDPRVSQAFGAYIRSLIVTGCRRTELTLARLSWLEAATPDRPALLTIPAAVTKNGHEHVLPLPPLLAGVIASVRRYADADLLFPGRRSSGKTVPISGWSKSWPALLKVALEYGLTGALRIHDLRKSARSHWERLGVADRVAEALLNHAEPDKLKSIYVLHDPLTEKSAALTLWCAEIGRALELRKAPSADVVVLPSGQKAIRRRAQSRRKSAK
jgi:integrase